MSADITQLLQQARDGDAEAVDLLYQQVYDELRRLARAQLRRRSGGTLNTTGLVHEAYLKLFEGTQLGVKDRGHFFALSARAMRQILVDLPPVDSPVSFSSLPLPSSRPLSASLISLSPAKLRSLVAAILRSLPPTPLGLSISNTGCSSSSDNSSLPMIVLPAPGSELPSSSSLTSTESGQKWRNRNTGPLRRSPSKQH